MNTKEILKDEEAADEVAKLLGLGEPDSLVGGLIGFQFEIEKNKLLTFGYANGPLGYEFWDYEQEESIASGEFKENADAHEQFNYINEILTKFKKNTSV